MRRRRLSFYLLVLLLAYVSWVPFYYLQPLSLQHFSFSAIKYFPFFLCAILIFSHLPFHVERVGIVRPIDPLLWVYWLLCLASLYNAEHPMVGMGKLVYFSATGAALAYCIRSLGLDDVRSIPTVLVSLGSGVSCYGIWTYVAKDGFLWAGMYHETHYYSGVEKVSSTIGNPIMLGAVLTLILPFCIAGVASRSSTTLRLGYLMAGLATLICAVLTFARSAWVSVGVVVFVWAVIHRTLSGHVIWRRRMFVAFVCALLVAPVLQMLLRDSVERAAYTAVEKASSTFRHDPNVEFRVAQFKTTAEVMAHYPLGGVGFGNFTRIFERVKDGSTTALDLPNAAHTTENMYLMVIVETGLPSLLVLLCFFGTYLNWLRKRYLESTGDDTLMVLAVISSTAGFLVNIFFWDGLNQPAVRILFWSIVGLGFAIGNEVRKPGYQQQGQLHDNYAEICE